MLLSYFLVVFSLGVNTSNKIRDVMPFSPQSCSLPLHRRGESRQPPPMCSIHLDDATASHSAPERPPHTPAYWGVRTHTDHRVSTPAVLTNTSSSSNLVFPGGLQSRYWPGITLGTEVVLSSHWFLQGQTLIRSCSPHPVFSQQSEGERGIRRAKLWLRVMPVQ